MDRIVPLSLTPKHFDEEGGPVGIGGDDGICTLPFQLRHPCPQSSGFLTVPGSPQEEETIQQGESHQYEGQHGDPTANTHGDPGFL